MSLSDLASIGSLVSGLAVLASLVYLSLQVWQTERNQRALMNQGVLSRGVSVGTFVTQPHINSLWTRTIGGETKFLPAEIMLLNHTMRTLLLNLQDAFVQHKAGLTDQITFDNSMNMAKSIMAQPVFRALWSRSRETFAPDLSTLVERLIHEGAPAGPIDLVAQFESDLAIVSH